MEKRFLWLAIALVLLLSLMPMAISPQPPVITDTLYVARPGWGPYNADPVAAYDTFSGELIFNVYDTLIRMGEPVTNSWGSWDVYEQYWKFSPSLATNVPNREDIRKTVSSELVPPDPVGFVFDDGSVCVGWVDNHKTGDLDEGDVIYTMETDGSYRTWFVEPTPHVPEVIVLWRGQYVFNTRVDRVIIFVNETGHAVDTFDVLDAEYSFKRGLVQDPTGGPMWMFYKPLFDQMNSDQFNSNATEPTAMTLAHLIDDAVVVVGGNLTINVGIPFPDLAFKQTLSQTWGSIVSREFSIGIGCWNGDLFADDNGDGYPNWWTQWRHVDVSPYDASMRWVGTGPYRVALYDPVGSLVSLGRNADYWLGWPAAQRKAYLETIELKYISSWSKTKSDFLNGDYDLCTVPRQYVNELLDAYGQPIDPSLKTIKSIVPVLSNDAAFFQLAINPNSPYILSGQFPDGIPVTFFNDTHVRRAFAYGFNHTTYINGTYRGEASWRATPFIYGLIPDYYTTGSHAPYESSLPNAESELKQAIFSGTSVWDSGFTVSLPYPYFNDRMKLAWEILRDFFAQLSAYDGRTGPPFTINVIEEPIIFYNQWWEYRYYPMFLKSWLADFADADNFARPYMYSSGEFAAYQDYTEANGWGGRKDELIDMAVKTVDGTGRAALYAELQDIYLTDAPSFPVAQATGRMWMKYWVKGWYYNALYPAPYYYSMYKENFCWGDIMGPLLSGEVIFPDGTCSMRDVGYVAGKFGTKAPDTSGMQPTYYSKWAPGTYGCFGADVYGDRKVDMRDIGFMCSHFGHSAKP